MLLILNLVLQVMDGLLTYVAINRGFSEGNSLIAYWISAVGVLPALLYFKSLSSLLVLGVYIVGDPQKILPILAALISLLAVGPWVFVLS